MEYVCNLTKLRKELLQRREREAAVDGSSGFARHSATVPPLVNQIPDSPSISLKSEEDIFAGESIMSQLNTTSVEDGKIEGVYHSSEDCPNFNNNYIVTYPLETEEEVTDQRSPSTASGSSEATVIINCPTEWAGQN